MTVRATYLTQPGIRLLDDWGVSLRRMFKGQSDVDVRVMLDTDEHLALAFLVRLDDLNLAVSLWGQQVTGLPIDFQVQQRDEANAQYEGRRHPLGMRYEA